MIKIAFLVPDNRQEFGKWDLPAPVFGPAPQAVLDGFAQLDDCEVHVVFCLKRPLPVPERMARNIFLHAAPVPPLGYLKTLYAGCIRALRPTLRRLGVQIVHGQGSERFPALSAALSGLPNVITLHGNMRELARFHRVRPFTYLWMAARVEGWALRKTRGVVCISNYTRRLVGDLPPRTWVVPNAADDSFFDISRAPVAPPELLCVGFVNRRKNQINLIRALDPLAKELPFTVKFLGHVSDDEYGREFAELLRTRPWCQAPGVADRPALREALRRATALVLPSLEDNCPMVVLESMAAGLPVVGANIAGVPELIEHNSTGLLFDPEKPDEIRDPIAAILRNPALAEAMGRAGRAAAEKRFRPKVIAARHLEIYREVLGR